jgi:beclin 1
MELEVSNSCGTQSQSVYELYNLWTKLMVADRFDQAMVAFLDCLQQFKLFIERMETGFNLPYRIDKDKIGDTGSGTYSIK